MKESDAEIRKKAETERKIVHTQSQWFVKSPKHTSYFDGAFKVLPSMNFPTRIKSLEKISKQNQLFYHKLQNIKSTINTKQILERNISIEKLKTRITAYGPDGKRKKDPLFRKFKPAIAEGVNSIILPV